MVITESLSVHSESLRALVLSISPNKMLDKLYLLNKTNQAIEHGEVSVRFSAKCRALKRSQLNSRWTASAVQYIEHFYIYENALIHYEYYNDLIDMNKQWHFKVRLQIVPKEFN